jgi:hypothetical protein
MSLDVYLKMPTPVAVTPTLPKIYIREDGQTKEVSRAEWDERFPGREPVVIEAPETTTTEVYSANITHNLGKMADEAGIYKLLWRPEEIGIAKAAQLVEPLTAGLAVLKQEPERFKAFNPENGWGSYDGLVRFTADYLAACRAFPDAEVSVWR